MPPKLPGYNRDRARRFVHLAEGALTPRSAKTTTGILRYSEHPSVALIDSTRAGQTAQDALGHSGAIPVVASLAEAMAHAPNTLVIGISPPGGRLPESWRGTVKDALRSGLDVLSGLHEFLTEDEELCAAARAGGATMWDVRKAEPPLPVGTGLCRYARSYIALMVGTDCAIGKMTVALEIERDARARGVRAEFIATGQTGIMIAGWGSPIDAIPGDFMAGCVERDCLSVEGADMILVEGQGSLLHPGFSSVTLALLHGSCPDGLVLCHEVGRPGVSNIRDMPFPPLREVGQAYVDLLAPFKKTEVVAVCLNTRLVSEAEARAEIERVQEELRLPTTDPVRFGAAPLTEALLRHRAACRK